MLTTRAPKLLVKGLTETCDVSQERHETIYVRICGATDRGLNIGCQVALASQYTYHSISANLFVKSSKKSDINSQPLCKTNTQPLALISDQTIAACHSPYSDSDCSSTVKQTLFLARIQTLHRPDHNTAPADCLINWLFNL
jgi:hypothetical protein